MIIILAKKAEIFNEALGLSWNKSKLVFDPQDVKRLNDWFEKNKARITQAIKFNLFWQKNSKIINIGDHIFPQAFLRNIDELGYHKTNFVGYPGEYAHRGEIIDIYPVNLRQPIRIEFLGNTIERCYFLSKKELRFLKEKEKFSFAGANFFSQLSSGDYLVHIDHGIGRFRGLLLRQKKKYYEIEYAAGDLLLVPEGLENRLSPYLGFITPRLTRLGGSVWYKTKKRVKEDALKFAKELLQLSAKREISQRNPYAEDYDLETKLDASFDYELTEDQEKAWQEIDSDLRKKQPMDRLICGDVGFGKTEIALRTAFRVALNGYQVALIAPTTILADQHYLTFTERLKEFPLKTQLLTRLIPFRQQKEILQNLKDGKIDILIGTHRLLSQDIKFRKLGLLIIDEEQRFGVRQKEKLKKIRENIDILSLSATPIPRTLNMALCQLKDISIIQTPPLYKLPIKTKIALFDKKLIQQVIAAEIARQGQVYYLHNRIGTLSTTQEHLKEILPSIRFASLHGRMNEKDIIETIHRFRDGKFDVLIATSIIENGLDLKNVNTLIVEDATRLGLAQAHQIRGRIGRGEKQSFAYFLYPRHSLTQEAWERLLALEKFSYLGAGYQIAAKDLEIRGAGNLLGKEQSGAINRVGLNLYYQILNQAIEQLKEAI